MIAELNDTTTAAAQSGPTIRRINLGDLHPSPTNPRKHFDEDAIHELAASIREHGIKMPLLARPSKTEPDKFEIVAGERRFRANTQLVKDLVEMIDKGSSVVLGEEFTPNEEVERLTALHAQRIEAPVIVEDLDDATVLELQLIENLQRKDLTALEEAEGYQRLLDLKDKDYTPEKIAAKIGKSLRTVLHKLRMLQAPKALRDALDQGMVGERHLVLVASIPGKKQREECAKVVIEGDYDYNQDADVALSVRETIALINRDYRQSLKGAPWKLEDAELVPAAGACANCPHFAAFAATQDAELAAELGNGRGQTDPLTCMKPECFKSKQAAMWKRRQEDAKDGTVKVLKPAEAKKVIDDHGHFVNGSSSRFVKLDEKPGYNETGSYDSSKTPTWRELVLERLPSGSIVVMNTESAGIVELVDRALAIATAREHPEHGKLFSRAKAGGKAKKKNLSATEQKKLERERFEKRVELRMRPALLTHLHECAMKKGMGADTSLVVLETALFEAGMDGNRMLCEWRGLEPEPPKKGASLSQDHYRQAILKDMTGARYGKPEIDAMIMCAILSKWIKAYGLNISSLAPLQKHFGFDKKTITALATAEVKAEMDAKAKKNPSSPKAPKATAGKNSVDPTDVSSKKEASKTKAADKRAKSSAPAAVMETDYFHCDTCGVVCAVGADLVPDIAALQDGEFECSECSDSAIFGQHFEALPDAVQKTFKTWVPKKKPNAASSDEDDGFDDE